MPMEVSKKDSNFLWIGNSPFLDFVNSEMVQGGRPVDLLVGADDVLKWLGEAGFSLKVTIRPHETRLKDELLVAARGYRSALRLAAQRIAVDGSVPSHILRTTNEFLKRRNHWFETSEGQSGIELRNRWIVERPEDACAPIAHAFAQFVASADLSRLRKCKNPDCVLFFYDTSKGNTRTWCSLDICGNKLRVAAFRRRSG